MNITETDLPSVVIIQGKESGGSRTFFLEKPHAKRYCRDSEPHASFVHDNHTRTGLSLLRALHFQVKGRQSEFIHINPRSLLDVTVDTDPSMSTSRISVGIELASADHYQTYISPNYAHGVYVPSEFVDYPYKSTAFYDSTDECGFRWNDPALATDWPIDFSEPTVSDKGQGLSVLGADW